MLIEPESVTLPGACFPDEERKIAFLLARELMEVAVQDDIHSLVPVGPHAKVYPFAWQDLGTDR